MMHKLLWLWRESYSLHHSGLRSHQEQPMFCDANIRTGHRTHLHMTLTHSSVPHHPALDGLHRDHKIVIKITSVSETRHRGHLTLCRQLSLGFYSELVSQSYLVKFSQSELLSQSYLARVSQSEFVSQSLLVRVCQSVLVSQSYLVESVSQSLLVRVCQSELVSQSYLVESVSQSQLVISLAVRVSQPELINQSELVSHSQLVTVSQARCY